MTTKKLENKSTKKDREREREKMHLKIRFDTNTLTLFIKLSEPNHTRCMCIDLFVYNCVFNGSLGHIRFTINFKIKKQRQAKRCFEYKM